MNLDAYNAAKLREDVRHNLESEKAEAEKAKAARRTALSKMADSAIKGATGLAGMLAGRNNPSWRQTGDQALDDAATLSFVQLDKDEKGIGTGTKKHATHIIHTFELVLGEAEGFTTSPFYLAFKRIYDIQRGKNRGATNYTVADTMQYYFPLMTIAATTASIQRMIKIARHPELASRATIYDMLYTMGVSPDSIYANIANLETRVARLLSVLNENPLPADLPVLKRWIWLSSFVFKDSTEHNFTSIIMLPASYHSIDTAYHEYLTQRKDGFAWEPGSNHSYEDVCDLLDNMEAVVKSIMQNVTMQAIAGDIINGFEGNLVKWDVASDYSDSPYIYDEEFLLQYQNAYFHVGRARTFLTDMFGLTRDITGDVGQGPLNSLGKLSHFLPVLEETHQADVLRTNKVVHCLDYEALDAPTTAMALSFVVGGTESSSLSYYYWNPADGALTNATAKPDAGRSFGLLSTYSTEIVLSGLVFMGSNRLLDISSNEVKNVVQIGELQGFDVLPWFYYYPAGSNFREIFAELDHYAVLSTTQFDTITAISNQALWGYSSLKLESKNPAPSRPEFTKRGKKPFRAAKTGPKGASGPRAGTPGTSGNSNE
jgi:hypothetical protein